MKPSQSLKLLEDIFERLESPNAEGLVTLSYHEVPSESATLLDYLISSGLVKTTCNMASCIECGAKAEVQKGGENDMAVCEVCGTVFSVHTNETVEYQISIAALAGWLARLHEDATEPEQLDDGIYFLGHHQHGDIRYEIHLMHGSSWGDASKRQQAIIQQMTDPAVVLCLGNKPAPFTHKNARAVGLRSCLTYDGNTISLHWPDGTFSSKDSTKQYAAHMRVANDPAQKCKESLKGFIRKNIHDFFGGLMHPEIRKKIEEKCIERITYEDKNGNEKRLSKQMILDAAKEVLEEKGLHERISGR